MDSKTPVINQTLAKAEEMENEAKLVMKPYANWEEYLAPTPLTLAILGELVFISSKTDFSINKKQPEGGYKYIRYPDSFRACLMQVCNSAWEAFNESQNNMDQIRLHTMTVPNYMKTAVKILFLDNDKIVTALLPKQLDNIKDIANKCVTLANTTKDHFTGVLKIIHELLEVCVSAEGCYGKEVDDIKKKLDEAKKLEDSKKKAIENAEKIAGEIKEQLTDAHKSFDKELKSMPHECKVVQLNILSFIFGSVEERAFKKETENAKFRIEQRRNQLDKSKEAYEKSVQDMEKNQKELTEILTTMRNCEFKEIDFNKTINMLVKGMDAMGKVKTQWENLVSFFQLISNIVEITVNQHCNDFAITSEAAQRFCHDEKQLIKDVIYNQAFQATNFASIVHLVSTTYTEVSRKYLLNTVSSLGKLMAMDKETEEFEEERKKFQESCTEAQGEILNLVRKNKEDFQKESQGRLEKFNKELLAILPNDVTEIEN